jgi:predicted RNA-binding protein YlxR (DUF448 family)
MASQHTSSRRRVPERRCVACRRVRPKRELVRIVRMPDGAVAVDPTGKRSGRGAYLCRTRACWDLGLRRRALEYALKTTIGPDDRRMLIAFGSALPEESNEAGEPASAGGT